jgi:hypothetical protein
MDSHLALSSSPLKLTCGRLPVLGWFCSAIVIWLILSSPSTSTVTGIKWPICLVFASSLDGLAAASAAFSACARPAYVCDLPSTTSNSIALCAGSMPASCRFGLKFGRLPEVTFLMPNRPLAGVFAAQDAIEFVVVSIACSHSGKLYFEGECWRRIPAPGISDNPAPGCSRRLGSGCPA